MNIHKHKIHISTICLVTVGMFDLVTTLMLINRGGVAEGNPWFAWLVEHGSLALVVGKLLFLAGPIVLLEFVRTKKPHSAEIGTWVAFVLYLYLYVGHILKIVEG